MFRLLIRTRLLIAHNVALDRLRHHPVTTATMSVVAIGLFGAMFAGFILFFEFAASLHILSETVYQACYYLFLLLLAGAVPFIASTLFQSEDYNLLFVAPIPPRAVIAGKLVDATLTNSIQFAVLGLPAIVAIAVAADTSPVGWLFVPILILLFLFMPALLTAAGLLAALACIGMARLRSAITLINVLMGAIVCLSFVYETRNLPVKFGGSLSFAALQPALSATSALAHSAPSHWFAEVLLAAGSPDRYAMWRPFSAIVVTDAILFAACMALGARLLSVASLSAGAGNGSIRSRRSNGAAWYTTFSQPLSGLIIKDWKFVLRDSMLVSQLSVPLILYAVPFVVVIQNHMIDARTAIYPFAVAIIGIIVYMQTSILSLSLLGMEAQSFWVLLTAPDSRRIALLGKWLLCTLVCSAIGITLGIVAGVALHAGLAALLIQAGVTVVSASALCALGVGISAVFPRFVHENPGMRVSPWALIIGFFATSAYVLISILIFAVGAYLISLWGPLGSIATTCTTLYLLLTLTVTVVPLELGARHLERYEWEH